MQYKHTPAMLDETIRYLNCRPGKIYVDGTLGGSGHASAICRKIMPGGFLIGVDQDTDAVENAKEVLNPYKSNIYLFRDNFISLPDILSELSITAVDGILLDLGLSQHQLESSNRGFSFKGEEPLDMRMNRDSGTTAGDLVNKLEEKELEKIFKDYGEERWARRIAFKIAAERKKEMIRTNRQLSGIILSALPAGAVYGRKIHPATRVYMALRIAVNRELEILEKFMEHVADYLNIGGRLCVLSFHSLEDRIVKQKIKHLEKGCICPPSFPRCVCDKKPQLKSLTRKVVRPGDAEIALNPMARSTRLRAAEKV